MTTVFPLCVTHVTNQRSPGFCHEVDPPDEDAKDQTLYGARKAALAAGHDSPLPEPVSMLLLRGNSRLKAIRLWREMSQPEMADKVGIGQSHLSDLESGRRTGSADVLRALAERLDVPLEWVAP